jgi:NAD(P)-dependent dehydrogenase (short-subunit alcohol dehydrogenase family)
MGAEDELLPDAARDAGGVAGAFTTPEGVATLVARLACPRTSTVTGANLVIDGGLIKTT